MPSRHDERQKGRRQLRIGQIVCRHMAAQVMHRRQRQPGGQREAFCEIDPHQQCANQAGPGRDGDAVDIGQRQPGTVERHLCEPANRLHMGP